MAPRNALAQDTERSSSLTCLHKDNANHAATCEDATPPIMSLSSELLRHIFSYLQDNFLDRLQHRAHLIGKSRPTTSFATSATLKHLSYSAPTFSARYNHRDLKALALTCRRFTIWAQEMLCYAPSIFAKNDESYEHSQIFRLVRTLQERPDLRSKEGSCASRGI
ncbi:hypothetical protein K505DRAFT_340161 [Melanomma pulvis-pyrius CBS 109.77]|uniref:Uncharacterized protein n=1 Tax=Melanomma pulvis-pyrius CBS 109.77 TaxID=1314802 RepID=A0A6A6X301_9PLEO|nr:hypothetical protein K505DRAFT_340161 [Melanomma pulvis-pyrius CBS 109.77]